MQHSFIPKCLLAALFCIGGHSAVHACGWDGTTNYYLFHPFDGDRYAGGHTQERLAQWWTAYAGKTITTDDLTALAEVEPFEIARSNNAILRAARAKGDTQMQQYLDLLCQYLHAVPLDFSPWDYPSETEIAANHSRLQKIRTQAGSRLTGKLAPQYTLLYIRAAFQLERWQDVVNTWERLRGKQPASVFYDMAEGFYAGALRKLNRNEDACEIYARLGDLHSATWCMRDGRNLGSIRRLYENDPNSAAVRLLLQDFVNNAQETLDNPTGGLGTNTYWSRVYREEVNQFVDFAETVAREGRAQDLCLWLSAAAWLRFLHGETGKAAEQIERALTLPGKQTTKDNARAIRLAISTATATDLNAYEQFLLPELQWLHTKAGGSNPAPRYANYAVRIYRQHLVPLYEGRGRTLEATLLMQAADNVRYGGYEHDDSDNTLSYGNIYVSELFGLSSAQLEEIFDRIFQKKLPALSAWLFGILPKGQQEKTFYADLIGTRALAEGNFERAAKWEARVPTEFISRQAISYYMARRDYHKERWMGPRQRTSGSDGWDEESLSTVQENQKLAFAREALALTKQTKKASAGRARAEAFYKLASILYQASDQGDCWYLSHYSHSSEGKSEYLDSLAYDYLCKAEQTLGNKDDALRTRILFAKSYVNLDNGIYDSNYNTYRFWSYDYDWQAQRYSLVFYPDNQHQQSRDYTALRDWLRKNPALAQADYLTRCDVLRTWMSL